MAAASLTLSSTTAPHVPAIPLARKLLREWQYFAELTGPAGVAWSRSYSLYSDQFDVTQKTIYKIHAGRIEEASDLIDRFAGDLASMYNSPRSMQAVMARSFHGLAGYLYYRLQQPDRARAEMQKAHEAVAIAIGEEPFLIMLAWHCLEFWLHRARISRSESDWAAVHRCLSQAGDMVSGKMPLCETVRGEKIFGTDISAFVRELGPLEPEARQAVLIFLDDAERDRIFRKERRDILRIPGFCIDYF